MSVYLSTVEEAVGDVSQIYLSTFENFIGLTQKQIVELRDVLTRWFGSFRSEINIWIEDDYVDKMYRDTYYNYFSTKRDSYPRNCIRLSFFDVEITDDIFFDRLKTEEIRKGKHYLGFMILQLWKIETIARLKGNLYLLLEDLKVI